MESIGIYIHVPFCEQKCPYCDFYSVSDKSEFDRYVNHVLKTTEELSDKHKRTVSTIYFGGGTPSVLGTYRLVEILFQIKECFDVTSDAEVTVEVNPCSSDNLDFSALYKSGFNRISIGLQSANENELKILGRKHSLSNARETVKKAKKAGFENISLDLMLCIPQQTKSSLAKSIKFCNDCDVTHISSYILKVEPNTPFYSRRDEILTFNDDEQAQLYLFAVSQLQKYGYYQYEISNFSKPGYDGKHNLKYWRCEEYLGIGPSAHSFIDKRRYFYPRDFEDFYNRKTVDDGVGGDVYEYVMLKLRLKEGVNLITLENKYSLSVDDNFLYRANKLKSEGLIDFDNNTISLTAQGFLVSNSIINYLVDAI